MFNFLFVSLSAGLLRQATYTTTRLGIYTILFEKMTGTDGRPPSFLLKVMAAPVRLSGSVRLTGPRWLTVSPSAGSDRYDSRSHRSFCGNTSRGRTDPDDG